ncbi:hypothetical protein AYI68_g920 [Smittium mucronatum]|uniref:Uncharacterized protein n=1 Tax=Smittium mucronatum TaxID=133383 RepID=A0A1R0H6Y8_9FUNG|nr:hypothetical protein AYI68_g920 [Smittium mucronatum]
MRPKFEPIITHSNLSSDKLVKASTDINFEFFGELIKPKDFLVYGIKKTSILLSMPNSDVGCKEALSISKDGL